MIDCVHPQILRLVQENNGFSLHCGGRLEHIARALPRPLLQFPSTVLFLGRTVKGHAIRSLYPESRAGKHRHHGIANAVVDPSSAESVHPLIIADASPSQSPRRYSPTAEERCHGLRILPIDLATYRNTPPRWEDLLGLVQARLVFLVTDVLCIFCEDSGGLAGVAAQLASWAAIGSASTLPPCTRPRIVVVTQVEHGVFQSQQPLYRSQLLSIPRYADSFSSLAVVNLPDRGSLAHLKGVISQEVDAARNCRLETDTLFSATHAAAFFERAVSNFAAAVDARFDFVASARLDTPVNPRFQEHLRAFMHLCAEHSVPRTVALSYISSTILFDGFRPGVHLFNSSTVFQALYKPLVARGLDAFVQTQESSAESVCGEVDSHLVGLFSQMKINGRSAKSLHIEVMRRHSECLSSVKSNRDCLYCLQGAPEHVLECGHAKCDACVANFGELIPAVEYRYKIRGCHLCLAASHCQARLLPPTCGARLFSIDGGGSQGIIPLAFLDSLQDVMGLPYPIQEHCDFGIGTSSGGLIILALCAKYWGTKRCIEFFQYFAKRIFPPPAGGSCLARLYRLFASYFSDGKYDASRLEDSLQKAFGFAPLFDSVGLRPSGMKFAVTATTISNATLCLFSNYNRHDSRSEGFRCKHIRASKASDEVLLWEPARCTTAAPWYFEPKCLEPFGTFQDGALKNVNPVRPGMLAVEDTWKDGECDFVLSIGTGFQKQDLSPKAPNFRNVFQDGALARLYRASMSSLSLSGENSWTDHWHGLHKQTRANHFRLNLPLAGREPELDDVNKMCELQEMVGRNLGGLRDIARALKAASFFFELDQPWVRSGPMLRCHGSILCRSPNSRALIQNLTAEYPSPQFVTSTDAPLGFLSPQDICASCGRFQKLITLEVRHPSELVDINLKFNRLFRRSIAGFPHTMQWFEDRQMIKAKFGRPDRKDPSDVGTGCECVQRRVRPVEERPASRKRSLRGGDRRSKRRRVQEL